MPRVDFVISNNSHHVDMFEPLAERLIADPGYSCQILSLCELRGLRSPTESFTGAPITRIPSRSFRPSPASGRRTGGVSEGVIRSLVRTLAWHQLIAPGVKRWLKEPPDLVVVPNDGAYPYDRIMKLLKSRAVPCCLVQEGIKFRRTGYGTGDVEAVAAWGENSAAFFRGQGIPAERIHQTGNPRFEMVSRDEQAAAAREVAARLDLGSKTLLFASNPIDDLKLCTTRQKLDLVSDFIAGIEDLFDDPDFHLVLKLHPRESVREFTKVARAAPHASRIAVAYDEPLYPLLTAARAAVVLASTVGIDALLLRVPLGVLEIPGRGFAFDYVQSGAAAGLRLDESLPDRIRGLLASDAWERSAGERYLERNLKGRPGATQRVIELIEGLAGG